MPSDMPHFKIRLPAELLERIRQAADEAGRTQTAEMVRRLKSSFDSSNDFPLDTMAELRRFAARSKPPTTAQDLALKLVEDGLSQLRYDEELLLEREREHRAALGSLSQEQCDKVFSYIETLRSEDKSNKSAAKKTKKRWVSES